MAGYPIDPAIVFDSLIDSNCKLKVKSMLDNWQINVVLNNRAPTVVFTVKLPEQQRDDAMTLHSEGVL